MTSRLGETLFFVLLMASSSRCAHHLYTTRNELRLAMRSVIELERVQRRLE
jgi:hypothetical protein